MGSAPHSEQSHTVCVCVCIKYLHPLSCVFTPCKGTAVCCLASINKQKHQTNEWDVHTLMTLLFFSIAVISRHESVVFFFCHHNYSHYSAPLSRHGSHVGVQVQMKPPSPSDTRVHLHDNTHNAPQSDTPKPSADPDRGIPRWVAASLCSTFRRWAEQCHVVTGHTWCPALESDIVLIRFYSSVVYRDE